MGTGFPEESRVIIVKSDQSTGRKGAQCCVVL